MGDSQSRKSGSGPGAPAPSAPSPAASAKPVAPQDEFEGKSGRIVHDERGNAVWDWIKETSRIAIDSTSRLLKRLEVPELKMEDTQKNNELSLESDRDAGGGYNPYGGSTSGGRAAFSRAGGSTGSRGPTSGDPGSGATRSAGTANTRASGNSGSNSGGANIGGGYDPYGKGVTRKSGR
jgi:hypothetical protein